MFLHFSHFSDSSDNITICLHHPTLLLGNTVAPFEDNGSCSGSDTEVVNTLFQGSLQSEKIIDRKASLQNPVSSDGAPEEIYDCSLKQSFQRNGDASEKHAVAGGHGAADATRCFM
ncbi:hypothetical protein SO802_006450 [Lithocarpus litseifolius]|uniref:Uncharacterized protein n=1 Tax=Lithocarpus litseifolius TaxID=425828 RepID=A0AAW2DNG8_9ROSI